MPKLTIDGHGIDVAQGGTILEAAQSRGIEIPTLCHRAGLPHYTSCLLCVVEETTSGKLLPSCSALVHDGMVIETRNPAVEASRRMALDLLLSEHVGDCEAPCRRACPAHMNIPLMIRQIGRGEMREAILTVKRHIALPAVLGRICPAPCEKACRRQQVDHAVSICLLRRHAADVDMASGSIYLPKKAALTDKRVAIVGAGPTGLAAAWYVLQRGHACTVLDDHDRPGGTLRTDVPEDRLPRDVLDREIELIRALGGAFKTDTRVGRDVAMADLRRAFDAVVIATGRLDAEGLKVLEVPGDEHGVKVDRATLQTDVKGVFAGGGAIGVCKMAVKACADGRRIAESADRYIQGQAAAPRGDRFNSAVGRLRPEEIPAAMQEARAAGRIEPAGGLAAGFTKAEAEVECARCMRCDCRKPESCRLRRYADEYSSSQYRYRGTERRPMEKIIQPGGVYYEPGKCIKCGLCVRITETRREELGLTFVGRGFDVRVAVPFNETLAAGLTTAAAECVEACPTAALAFEAGEPLSTSSSPRSSP